MEIISDYSLTKSFVSKKVQLLVGPNQIIYINLVPLKDFYSDDQWVRFYNFINMPIKDLRKNFNIKEELDLYDIVNLIIITLGQFREFATIYQTFLHGLEKIIDNLSMDLSQKAIYGNKILITREIFDYIMYIIKSSCGEKIEAPRQFSSEEERLFYLAQKEYDDQIKGLRQKEQASADAMLKVLLSITYAFPNFTFDYLFEQTLAQIRWLQKYAAEAASYEVNKQIFAAGNMKKGSKLNFFIK